MWLRWRRKPTAHAIDAYVRRNSETLRAYNWREIEAMREDLAAVSMSRSRHAAALAEIRESLSAVEDAMQRARAVKDYKTSDALRAIVQALSQPLA